MRSRGHRRWPALRGKNAGDALATSEHVEATRDMSAMDLQLEPLSGGALARTILDDTFSLLDSTPGLNVSARRIVRLRLSRYFTIVELDDGSVGCCMSYSQASDSAIAQMTKLVNQRLTCDPLGRLSILTAKRDLLLLSLKASLISALSAPILRAGGDASAQIASGPQFDLLDGAESALVVGFGGYMGSFASDPRIKRLHVADLGYVVQQDAMDEILETYRRARPTMKITISDGHDTHTQARAADVVAITGSALCNGTMEQLLLWASGSRIIVQGQSAAIYPAALFARGVAMVATTLKPPSLIDIADRGALAHVLERGLPWIYLSSARRSAGKLVCDSPQAAWRGAERSC